MLSTYNYCVTPLLPPMTLAIKEPTASTIPQDCFIEYRSCLDNAYTLEGKRACGSRLRECLLGPRAAVVINKEEIDNSNEAHNDTTSGLTTFKEPTATNSPRNCFTEFKRCLATAFDVDSQTACGDAFDKCLGPSAAVTFNEEEIDNSNEAHDDTTSGLTTFKEPTATNSPQNCFNDCRSCLQTASTVEGRNDCRSRFRSCLGPPGAEVELNMLPEPPPPPPTTKDCNNVYYTCCGTTSTSPWGKCDEDETLNKTCIEEYFICKFSPPPSRDAEASTKVTTNFDFNIIEGDIVVDE